MLLNRFFRVCLTSHHIRHSRMWINARCYGMEATQPKPEEPDERESEEQFDQTIPVDIPPNLPLQRGTAQLTYVGQMTSLIKRVKRFSLFTSAVGVCFQPLLAIKLASASTALTVSVLAGTCVPVFVVPLALHHVCRRYVTHMYYDATLDQFTATRFTFFLRQREFAFTRSDVSILYNESFFKTCTIRGEPYFVDELGFLHKDVYMKFKKFDQPFDYGFNDADKKT